MWIGEALRAWVALWLIVGVRLSRAACTMAEFPCRNQQCISLDQYCDGQQDCEDNSDEPSGCSPCNRTYYGKVGATYTIQIPRPSRGTLPHFCQLTFIASGDVYGDLVQLSLEKFNLGRFISHTTAGCPDGYMQIEELSRPLNAGYWCGTAWGHNVYYSETSAITLMLRVFNVSDDASSSPYAGQASNPANPGSFMPQDSVMLKLSYRFLRKERAVLRYGPPYSPSYRGEDVPNSFCDKYFEDCDKKNCKIQSPNFPGMYPRNLTCYYHIKQKKIPDAKVALIRVRQRNPHLIYIKDRNAPHISREQRLQVGSGCHVLHDYLVAFDGNSTREPVLSTLCKGGTALSRITSSGSELLLLFHASPFDYPFQDSPRRRVFGFELDVEVEFVDRESTAYIRGGSAGVCEYIVTSKGQRSGYIQSPVHSLLPNTTCIWRLLASSSEVVWMYFLHYRHVSHDEMPAPAQCPNTLTIFDGDTTKVLENSTSLMGQFCKPDKLPKVCSGVHAPGPHSSPCSADESYVSSLPALSLSLRYAAGTAPAHVEFLARYEFVDLRQWGEPTPNGGSCDRSFALRPDRLFASPRDIFLFGRGGSKRLRCIYTFKVADHQHVLLRVLRSRMGSTCGTVYHHSSRRDECSHGGAVDEPAIWITEEPWNGTKMTRACLCNTSHERPFTITSYTNQLQLIFSIPVMKPVDDYNDFFFEGDFDVIDSPSDKCGDDNQRKMFGRHGNFTTGAGRGDPCSSLPRLITAPDGAFLFLRVGGFSASETNCGVASRINIYAVGGVSPLASVCPEKRDTFTEVFSSGWHDIPQYRGANVDDVIYMQNKSYVYSIGHEYYPQRQLDAYHQQGRRGQWFQRQEKSTSRDLLIEYSGNYSGRFLVTWVGVWRPLQTAPLSSAGADMCPHKCPEIQACLPAELWCDGEAHCPTGIDEGAAACGLLAALPWVYLLAASVLLLSLVALFIAVVQHKRRMQAQKEAATAAALGANGVKSATQDLLLPPEKDGW